MAALTAAVLLAHFALLQTAPTAQALATATTPFQTRVIAFAAVTQPSPPLPSIRPTAKPARTAVRPRASTAPTPAGSVETSESPPLPPLESASAPQSATNTETAAVATQDAGATDTGVPETAPPVREVALVLGRYTVPEGTLLNYQVQSNKFPFGLNAQLRWQHDAEKYEARLEYGAFGQSRVQTSRGQITERGLEPLRFSDKFRSEVAAHFVRDKGKVTFSANTPDVALLSGAQDRLSILMQLAAMIGGEPQRFQTATTISIQTIGPRDADTWLFTVGDEQTLTLPGGDLETLKLVRNPREQFDQKVELWLAPALGYLPARIRITEPNGDYVDQKWTSTERPG